jgi:hypothetical protein
VRLLSREISLSVVPRSWRHWRTSVLHRKQNIVDIDMSNARIGGVLLQVQDSQERIIDTEQGRKKLLHYPAGATGHREGTGTLS